MNFLRHLSHISFKPHDTSHELGRSKERYRLAALSISSSLISKGMGLLVMVVSVKLTAPYLGPERFGVWITISSFASMLSFVDFGIGNAITNRVAHAAAAKSRHSLQNTVSGSVGILLSLGLLISALGTFIAFALPWQHIIKTNDPVLQEEVRISCVMFGLLFGFCIVSNGVQKIFLGLQKSHIINMVCSIGYAVALLLFSQAAKIRLGIPSLILISLGISSMLNISMLMYLHHKDIFYIRGLRKATNQQRSGLLINSSLFFVLQICAALSWGADNLIISSTLGVTAVAVFGIAQKLFQLISQTTATINGPLWSSYADAQANADYTFLKTTLKKSIVLTSIISLILGLALVIWGADISSIWTNGNIVPSLILLVSFFVWNFVESIGSAFSIFMNGTNIVKPQVFAALTLIILSVPLKLILIKNFGIPVMLLGFSALYVLVLTFFYLVIFRKEIFSHTKETGNKNSQA